MAGERHPNQDSGKPNKRGFAAMDEERQREIASKGGQEAHRKGTAHEFDEAEAREAGRKGGQEAHRKGTAHEFDEAEAREAGKKGGEARGAQRAQQAQQAQRAQQQEDELDNEGNRMDSDMEGSLDQNEQDRESKHQWPLKKSS